MRILAGTRKGLLQIEPQGSTWNVVAEDFPGVPISCAWYDNRNDTFWAAAAHGHWGAKLYRRRTGEDWQEVEGPHFRPGDLVRPEKEASVEYIWTLASGGDSRPDRIYAGTVPGGLFISDDGGDSFELVESLWEHPTRVTQWFGGGFDEPGIHSVLVDPRNNDRVVVGISCAGVFESLDAGKTWSVRNKGLEAPFLPDPAAETGFDPHLVVSCPGAPDHYWQQNHDGIFRSTDSCESWVRVDEKGSGPAYFGFAIGVDEATPETAWVVPAHSDEIRTTVDRRLRICRTTDGGKSWTEFTEGLPDRDCYDLVYRHGLDNRNGNLVFGTTTGNMFASRDYGEKWEPVSWTLPPVYSVQLMEV